MELIKINSNNRPYYSDDFIKGFECGAKRQFEADKKARPKGEWIWSPRDMDGTVSGCCSNCSFSHLFIGGHTAQYNFCPSCGADMRPKGE